MLRLAIADPCETAPLDRVPDEKRVVEWREYDGSISLYGCVVNGQYLLNIAGVGNYFFRKDTGEVKAFPDRNVHPEVVRDTFRRIVLPMAAQALGTEVLHASAVRSTRGIFAFSASAETGKSTTTFALSRRGYSAWADDAVAFDASGAVIRALPLPFAIRLHPDARTYFDSTLGHSPGQCHACSYDNRTERVPIAGIFALQRVSNSGSHSPVVEVIQLSSSDAVRAIMGQAYTFTLSDRNRKRQMWINYLNLIARVPVYGIRFQPGLEKLGMVLDAIEQVMCRNRVVCSAGVSSGF